MNQILYIDDRKSNSSIDIKKIIMFFAVAIIIIGFIMAVEGSYSVYAYYKEKHKETPIEPILPEQADIQLVQTEDNLVNISVNSDVGISELIYNWNSETATTLSEEGKTSIFETIEMPVGENTLNIKVIDINGIETTKNKLFTVIAEKPIIKILTVGNDIKISVTSEIELSNITYKWNSENANIIDMVTYIDKKNIEKQIEIPVGQNTLAITATDIQGNIAEKSLEVRGAPRPKIEVYSQKGYLHFNITSEEALTLVEFTFNGKKYKMDSTVLKDRLEIHYKQQLVEGMNYIKITASTADATEEVIRKCNYKKQ